MHHTLVRTYRRTGTVAAILLALAVLGTVLIAVAPHGLPLRLLWQLETWCVVGGAVSALAHILTGERGDAGFYALGEAAGERKAARMQALTGSPAADVIHFPAGGRADPEQPPPGAGGQRLASVAAIGILAAALSIPATVGPGRRDRVHQGLRPSDRIHTHLAARRPPQPD